MRLGRVRTTASPLLVLAVALAGGAAYGYLQGAFGSAVAFGLGAIVASLFAILTDT